MVWDKTSPLGTDGVNTVDDKIRELKEDLETALRGDDADGVEAKFPGSDTANPVFRYRGLKGATGARPAAGQYGQYFDTTRNVLQRDNGSSWEDVGTVIPAGTVMVFYQAAAPTGFTKVVTHDDKALRVVSGAGGGTGGATGLSTGITPTIAGHTHTTPDSSHTHVLNSAGTTGSVNYTAGSLVGSDTAAHELKTLNAGGGETITRRTPTTDSQGSAGVTGSTVATTNTITLAYIDVILASKD